MPPFASELARILAPLGLPETMRETKERAGMHPHPEARPPAFRWSKRAARPPVALVLVSAALLGACETSVVSLAEVAEVEVSPEHITLVQGSRATASVILRESGGTELSGRAVTWSVEDSVVATVGSDGVVEGRSPGSTRIRASSEGVSGTADVTVLAGARIAVVPESVQLQATPGDASLRTHVVVVSTGSAPVGGLRVRVRGSGDGPADWLEAELSATTTPAELRLRAISGRLAAGSYEARVIVESSSDPNGAATVSVRLDVVSAGDEAPACDIRNHVFTDDFEVPKNTSCVFTNVHVRGKLTLREGARLTSSHLRVDKDLKADRAEALSLHNGSIDGTVEFKDGGSVTIVDSEIGEKLDIVSNRGAIDLRDNRIGDDVKLEKNRGGPFILLRNTVDGKLECKDNDPSPTGSGNVAGEKVEQCRGL